MNPGYSEGGDDGLAMRIVQSGGHGAKKVLNRSVESRAVINSKLPFASSNDGSAARDRGTSTHFAFRSYIYSFHELGI